MITNFMAPAARAARTLAALAAVVMLSVLLAQTAAAGTTTVRTSLFNTVKNSFSACSGSGGTFEVKWQGPPGKETGATVTCTNTDGGGGDFECTFTAVPKGTSVSCTKPFTRPEEPPYGDVPGGGTNAPAPVDDPRTEGGGVIIGTGTYAQDGGQPTTGQYDGGLDFGDGGQATTGSSAPVDTVEDEGPTTVEPVEPEVVAEDEEVTPFEYRRDRGGLEDQP